MAGEIAHGLGVFSVLLEESDLAPRTYVVFAHRYL